MTGEIDPYAVLRSLGYPEVETLERVLGGWETSLWRFVTPDGERRALRVYPGPQHTRGARNEEVGLSAPAWSLACRCPPSRRPASGRDGRRWC